MKNILPFCIALACISGPCWGNTPTTPQIEQQESEPVSTGALWAQKIGDVGDRLREMGWRSYVTIDPIPILRSAGHFSVGIRKLYETSAIDFALTNMIADDYLSVALRCKMLYSLLTTENGNRAYAGVGFRGGFYSVNIYQDSYQFNSKGFNVTPLANFGIMFGTTRKQLLEFEYLPASLYVGDINFAGPMRDKIWFSAHPGRYALSYGFLF